MVSASAALTPVNLTGTEEDDVEVDDDDDDDVEVEDEDEDEVKDKEVEWLAWRTGARSSQESAMGMASLPEGGRAWLK